MIHLRRIPKYTELQRQTHDRLKHEIEEQRLSQQIVDRHNERVRRNRIYRQTGELA